MLKQRLEKRFNDHWTLFERTVVFSALQTFIKFDSFFYWKNPHHNVNVSH